MAKGESQLHQALRAAIGEWTAGGGTLRGLAKAAEVNIASLVHFTNGKRSLKLEVAGRLAGALGLELVKVKRKKSKG